MKRFLFLIFLFAVYCDSFAMSVEVVRIVDGDTFVANAKVSENTAVMSVKVRLRNVDTPELHGQCADEIRLAKYAKQRLGELIPVGSVTEIKNIKNDKYAGRIDANVFDSANRDVGKVLIQENIGRPYSGGKRQSWCSNKN